MTILSGKLQERHHRSAPRETQVPSDVNDAMTQELIEAILQFRRSREQELGCDLFSDPAWDLLLELHAAQLRGDRLQLSSLAATLRTTESIAARWLLALRDAGLIECETQTLHATDLQAKLTAEGARRMKALLRKWRISPPDGLPT